MNRRNRSRATVLGSFLVASLVANASYDMVVMLDYSTKSLKRFDGQTGAYLGEIGAGRMIRPRFVERGPNAGEIVVTDELDPVLKYSTIHVFNVHTGELKRQLYETGFQSLAGIHRDPTTGAYTVADVTTSTTLRLHTINSALTAVTGFNAATIAGVSVTAFGADVAVIGGVPWVAGYSNAYRRVDTSASSTSFSNGGMGVTTCFGTMRSRTGAAVTYVGSNGGGTLAAIGATAISTTLTSVYGIGSGHEYDYVAGYRGGLPVIDVYNRSFLTGSFGTAQITNPADMVVITAPEPAVWLGLSVGLLVLLKRRR